MREQDIYDLEVDRVMKSTDKAFLFRIGRDYHWIPKSQIVDPEYIAVGDEGIEVGITEWIARTKGFLD